MRQIKIGKNELIDFLGVGYVRLDSSIRVLKLAQFSNIKTEEKYCLETLDNILYSATRKKERELWL